jgi:DNA topoisomerase I
MQVNVARLRRADCSGPGIHRRRCGRGFSYVGPSGVRVKDPVILARIRSLAIPPAWSDVWICPYPMGHIQATGLDSRGRRQYRYHDGWRQLRDVEKFDHMLALARVLPRLRRSCARYLTKPGLSRERVLAGAVRLLDLGFFRVGGEGYMEENETYGLATIEKRHVRVSDGMVTFDYPAKGGQRRIQSVAEPAVVALITELKKRRGGGRPLLVYRSGREWIDVRSEDINAFIKDLTGSDFTAKEFRTWSATVLAAVALAVSEGATSTTSRKRAVRRAVTEVGHYLGNTPAVARRSYVDPRVVDRYTAGETIGSVLSGLGHGVSPGEPSIQGAVEKAVLTLIEDQDDTTSEAA